MQYVFVMRIQIGDLIPRSFVLCLFGSRAEYHNGLISQILLSEATGRAFRDIRKGLWYVRLWLTVLRLWLTRIIHNRSLSLISQHILRSEGVISSGNRLRCCLN